MADKRQQLIDTAIALFNEHGFHAVGIDRIASEARVSKKTMYHHFRSKEELILAALRQQDGMFRNQFMKNVEATAADAHNRLLAVFDVAHQWFQSDDFFGCMFINAVGEYGEPSHAIREVCKEFKRLMRRYLVELATEVGAADPDGLADELALLLEGSIVTAQVSGNPRSAEVAKNAAKVLIDDALAASVAIA